MLAGVVLELSVPFVRTVEVVVPVFCVGVPLSFEFAVVPGRTGVVVFCVGVVRLFVPIVSEDVRLLSGVVLWVVVVVVLVPAGRDTVPSERGVLVGVVEVFCRVVDVEGVVCVVVRTEAPLRTALS